MLQIKDNSYGHPHKEVIDRLSGRNIKTYNTAELGNIVATIDGGKIEFITGNNQNLKQKVNIDLEELDIMASISDSKPTQNSMLVLNTKATSSSKSIEGAKVNILVHFKTGTASYEG